MKITLTLTDFYTCDFYPMKLALSLTDCFGNLDCLVIAQLQTHE